MATSDELEIIGCIARRLKRLQVRYAAPVDDETETILLVELCHDHHPLQLDELLAGPELDFTHDLCGIRQHLDRKTGELRDCFEPRYAERMGHVYNLPAGRP